MLVFIIRRVLGMVLVLVAVSFIVFLIFIVSSRHFVFSRLHSSDQSAFSVLVRDARRSQRCAS